MKKTFSCLRENSEKNTKCKEYEVGVSSDQYFPVFGLSTGIYTVNQTLDTFQTVKLREK